jgi:hypothetical protein
VASSSGSGLQVLQPRSLKRKAAKVDSAAAKEKTPKKKGGKK